MRAVASASAISLARKSSKLSVEVWPTVRCSTSGSGRHRAANGIFIKLIGKDVRSNTVYAPILSLEQQDYVRRRWRYLEKSGRKRKITANTTGMIIIAAIRIASPLKVNCIDISEASNSALETQTAVAPVTQHQGMSPQILQEHERAKSKTTG